MNELTSFIRLLSHQSSRKYHSHELFSLYVACYEQ